MYQQASWAHGDVFDRPAHQRITEVNPPAGSESSVRQSNVTSSGSKEDDSLVPKKKAPGSHPELGESAMRPLEEDIRTRQWATHHHAPLPRAQPQAFGWACASWGRLDLRWVVSCERLGL